MQKNISLKPFTTFGIEASAKYFLEIHTVDQARGFFLLNAPEMPRFLILGGGSNMLFTEDFDGVVMRNEIKGREIIQEDEESIWLKFGAGENWHECVLFCVENGWGGIENLSLIPGNIGAAPIQNIGAYGVELESVFHSLEALQTETGALHTFYKTDCQFGYRDSIFKRAFKGMYFISHVTLKLSKKPTINTSYGAIEKELNSKGIKQPTIKDVSKVVCNIRQRKLPDPKVAGNGGSFFKNPVVNKSLYETIKVAYPEIPSYPIDHEQVKIPAAWLIQTCGWKGKRFENYGVHPNQALVLVNYGGAKGKDIFELSEKIQASVSEKFKIALEREVNVI